MGHLKKSAKYASSSVLFLIFYQYLVFLKYICFLGDPNCILLVVAWNTDAGPGLEYFDEGSNSWKPVTPSMGHNGNHSIKFVNTSGGDLDLKVSFSKYDAMAATPGWQAAENTDVKTKDSEVKNLVITKLTATSDSVGNEHYFGYKSDDSKKPSIKFSFSDTNLGTNITYKYRATWLIWKTGNPDVCGLKVTVANLKDKADYTITSGDVTPDSDSSLTWEGSFDEDGFDTIETSTYTYDLMIENFIEGSTAPISQIAYKWPYCAAIGDHCLHAIDNADTLDNLNCQTPGDTTGEPGEGGGLPQFVPMMMQAIGAFGSFMNNFMSMFPINPIVEDNLDCGFYTTIIETDENEEEIEVLVWNWSPELGYYDSDLNDMVWYTRYGGFYKGEWIWKNDMGAYDENNIWIWSLKYGYYDAENKWHFYTLTQYQVHNNIDPNAPGGGELPGDNGDPDAGSGGDPNDNGNNNLYWYTGLGHFDADGYWVWNPEYGFFDNKGDWVWFDEYISYSQYGHFNEDGNWVWGSDYGFYDEDDNFNFYTVNQHYYISNNIPPIYVGNNDYGYYDNQNKWHWNSSLGSNVNSNWVWHPYAAFYDEETSKYVFYQDLGHYDSAGNWIWNEYFESKGKYVKRKYFQPTISSANYYKTHVDGVLFLTYPTGDKNASFSPDEVA